MRRAPAIAIAVLSSLPSIALSIAPSKAEAHCAPAAMPATVEWELWIGAGGGLRDVARPRERAVPEGTIGGGVTFQLMNFFGMSEVRAGPWLAAITDVTGIRGEGGLELVLTESRGPAAFGTWWLRLGGGYGIDDVGRAPSYSMTFAWGPRPVTGRNGGDAGRCFSLGHDFQGPEHAIAHAFRLFATARALFATDRDWTIVAGVEVDPMLWFPPYRAERLVGGHDE